MPESVSTSDRTPTTVAIVPAHALGPRVVLAVPDVPPAARRRCSTTCSRCSNGTSRTPRFLLDGQTAVLDDYLEVRPGGRRQRCGASPRAGALAVGPWMVLMDEFMVSGETIVRDLQLGMARAAELGGAMPVGYLPDMFGHVAQMPQLLRLAGLEHAVVWRGVPAAVDQTAFWWEAPDGSRVRAEYLYGSYSNGRDLPDDAKQLVARAHDYELELGDVRLARRRHAADERHRPPDAAAVARPRRRRGERGAGRLPLRRHVAARVPRRPADRRASPRGPASCARARGPTSSWASRRTGSTCTRSCAAAERALERRAEPLSALLLPAERVPARAARRSRGATLVLNSAHDSSCACSADEVVDQVRRPLPGGAPDRRRARAPGAARARAPRSTRRPARPSSSNPTGVDRGGIVTVTVPGDGPVHFVALDDGTPCPTQVLRAIGGEGFARSVVGQKVRWVLDLMRGPEFAGARIGRYEVERDGDVVDVTCLRRRARTSPAIDLEELRERAARPRRGGGHLQRPGARTRRCARCSSAVPPTPGFGWRTFAVGRGRRPRRPASTAGDDVDRQRAPAGRGRPGDRHLVDRDRRRRARRRARPARRRRRRRRHLQLLAAGRGPRRRPPGVGDGHDARVRPGAGPRARRVDYRWPERAIGDVLSCSQRSDETVAVTVQHDARAPRRRGVPARPHRVRQPGRDHRLRAHFPLPAPVDHSDAECAFAVVQPRPHRRRRAARVRAADVRLPPVRRRVRRRRGRASRCSTTACSSTRSSTTAASSRSRCCGRPATSRAPTSRCGRTRPARSTRSKGRSCSGSWSVEYAVLPHRGTWQDADLHARADELLVPLERVRGGGVHGAARPPTGRPLAGRGRGGLRGAARAGRSRRARLQPVGATDRRAPRTRRRARDRLGHRPARPPAGAVPGRARARPEPRSPPSASTDPSPDPFWRRDGAYTAPWRRQNQGWGLSGRGEEGVAGGFGGRPGRVEAGRAEHEVRARGR